MAKFCIECGKKLEEGEVCKCTLIENNEKDNIDKVDKIELEKNNETVEKNDEVVENNVVKENNIKEKEAEISQGKQEIKNEIIEKTKVRLLKVFSMAKEAILNPSQSVNRVADEENFKNSIILFIIQGLLTGIIVARFISYYAKEISSSIMGKSSKLDLKLGETIIVAVLISVLLSFIYSLILWVTARIFKKDVKYSLCVNIIGIRAVYITIISMISLVVSFISIKSAIVISIVISAIVSAVIIMALVKEIIEFEFNSYIIAMVVFCIAAVFVYVIVVSKLGINNIPSLRNISSLLNVTSSFGSMFGGNVQSDLSGLF